MDYDLDRVLNRMEAAIKLCYPQDMTPPAKLLLDAVIKDERERGPVMVRPNTEGGDMAAFIQGGMAMAASQMLNGLRSPTRVDQPVQDNGIFEDYFLMKLASGIVIRVTVTVDQEPA